MGDTEGSGGRDGIGGGGGGRDVVELIDPVAIGHYHRNMKEVYNLLFLGLGDVGLALNVSS